MGTKSRRKKKNLCNLIDAVFVETVSSLVEKLRKEKCSGCLVDHPSQRRHNGLMMTEREGWETYGLEAIETAIKQNLVWKQFIEVRPPFDLLFAPH